MKYMKSVITVRESKVFITVDYGDSFSNFPAELDNPNYVNFLNQADLTNEQVEELTPDIWYNFPEGI